jgi:hypothetical protein
MNTFYPVLAFGAEVAACLAVSALILLRLHGLLRRIGAEVCERGGASTEFWIAYTQLMMLVAPLLLVCMFSSAGHRYLDIAEEVRSALQLILWGQFIGLVLVGRAVWKTINPPTAPFNSWTAPIATPETVPKAEAA